MSLQKLITSAVNDFIGFPAEEEADGGSAAYLVLFGARAPRSANAIVGDLPAKNA